VTSGRNIGERKVIIAVALPRSAMSPVVSIALSVMSILLCGGLGAFAGFALVSAAGWTGIPSAIAATVVGMVVATLAWALGAALLRKLGWIR
jgi:hypothetical protein